MKIFTFFVIFIVLLSCGASEQTLPKPRIYPRVDFPEKIYVDFKNEECPFTMLIPQYCVYSKDSLKSKAEESFICWFDLEFENLNALIHFSYVDFNGRQEFDELVKDAFEMADKHNIRAKYRDEKLIRFPEMNKYGLLFEIDGPVASPLQFYLTDSTHHFLRASLYFNDLVNRDSIQPVYEFIRQDLDPLFESLTWK